MRRPDQYLFWDDLHPTETGHLVLADVALADVGLVPEPSCNRADWDCSPGGLGCSGPSFGGYLASALEVEFMRRRRSQSNRQLVESRW